MVLSGVNLVLGYKLSEENIRKLFKKYVNGDDGSDSEKEFDKYDFECSVDKYLKNKFKNCGMRCHRLPCCAYDNYSSDWILGIDICNLDGFDLVNVNSELEKIEDAKQQMPIMKKIFNKLKIGKYCDDDEPKFASLHRFRGSRYRDRSARTI